MREIVLDTETTGLSPKDGHRLVEIGCVELSNHVPTGRTWQQYINPERSMPPEALRVHGLTQEFLQGYPVFREVAAAFLEFIGESRLIIHNAEFDLGFLNSELERIGGSSIPLSRSIDTTVMARKKFPGAPASLDALCRRFEIDDSSREKHGALLDAQLLSEVYLELQGGRQTSFVLAVEKSTGPRPLQSKAKPVLRPPRAHQPTAEECAAHEAFIDTLADPLWRRYLETSD